jgi:hypothetical protein
MACLSQVCSPARADEPRVTVTWKTCAGASTLVTDDQACFVVDLRTGRKSVVFDLCAGVNVSGGTLLFGGRASSLFCATVEVPVGASPTETRKAAEQTLRGELERLCRQGKGPKNLCLRAVGPFKLRDGRDAPEALKAELSK